MRRTNLALFAIAVGIAMFFGFRPRAHAQNAASSSSKSPATAPATPNAPKPPYKRLTGPETLNPGAYPEHWPYPDEYDSAVAASEVHHIRFIDHQVRFVEVAYFPGVHGQMHGHPWSSVFAIDAPVPKAYNVQLDRDKPPIISHGGPPAGASFPLCQTMNPQAPHAETNQDTWPHHFYRLEFLRVDDAAIQEHWREWYPNLLEPLLPTKVVHPSTSASKFSPEWPFPIAYDSYRAAPNDLKLLYEDDHVRLVEVSIRPGETENVNGDPYSSVIAEDAISGATMQDRPLDPNSSLNGQGDGHGAAPQGFDVPTCTTTGPRAPHTVHNSGATPIHFYRVDFKRIDGDGLKTHWREWYPWMAKLTDEYHLHPYVSNYY